MIEKIIKHHHLKAQLHEFFALAICKPRHWNLGIGSGIWTPNLPGWWLRMREPHPQIHETHESRGYLVTLYFHIHKVLGPQNGKSHPKGYVTLWSCSHMTIHKRHISWTTGPMGPKFSRCWLFCAYNDRDLRRRKLTNPGISLFPSFFVKKVYTKCETSRRDVTESLCSPKINRKMTTGTRNVAMNYVVTNWKIHYLCESVGFKIKRSSHRKSSIKKVFLKFLQNWL